MIRLLSNFQHFVRSLPVFPAIFQELTTPSQLVPLYFHSLCSLPSSKYPIPVGSSLLPQSLFSTIFHVPHPSWFLSTSTVFVLCHLPSTPSQLIPLYFHSLCSLPSSKYPIPVGSSLLPQSVFSAIFQVPHPSWFLSTSTVCVLCHLPSTPSQLVSLYFHSLCSLPSSKYPIPVGSSLLPQSLFSTIFHVPHLVPLYFHSLCSLPSSKYPIPVDSSLLPQSLFSAIFQVPHPNWFLSTFTVFVLCHLPSTPSQLIPLYFHSLCSLPSSKYPIPVGSSLLPQSVFSSIFHVPHPSWFLSTSTVCVLCHLPSTPSQLVPLYFHSLCSLPSSKYPIPVGSSLLPQSVFSAIFQVPHPSWFLSTSTVCVLCHLPSTPSQLVSLYSSLYA